VKQTTLNALQYTSYKAQTLDTFQSACAWRKSLGFGSDSLIGENVKKNG